MCYTFKHCQPSARYKPLTGESDRYVWAHNSCKEKAKAEDPVLGQEHRDKKNIICILTHI